MTYQKTFFVVCFVFCFLWFKPGFFSTSRKYRYEEGVINMVIEFEFGFKKANGRVEEFCEACDCFEVGERYFIRDWRHSEFLQRKQELALRGSLVITCTLKQGTLRTPWQEPPLMKLMSKCSRNSNKRYKVKYLSYVSHLYAF